jgi:hypothetical protein
MFGMGIPELIIMAIIFIIPIVLTVFPFWKIYSKAECPWGRAKVTN